MIGPLCGSRYGDVAGFSRAVGTVIVYLDSCDYTCAQYCRALHQLRLSGWFDNAAVVLIGRTGAQKVENLDQRAALLDALGDLDIPVLYDVDVGHLPPQLLLVNGASSRVRFGPTVKSVRQTLA